MVEEENKKAGWIKTATEIVKTNLIGAVRT